MARRMVLSATFCGLLAMPAAAQDLSGIDMLMELCAPIAATGASVRAGLRDAGWTELAKPDAGAAVANLVASQMWHMESGVSSEQQLALTKDYTDGFFASLGNDMLGPIYVLGDEVAMVLAAEASVSCIWAGPDSDALKARIEAVGGFPAADGTVTGAKTQVVEAGGTEYRRIETYAYIEASDRAGPLPFAARLDRSPVQ